MNTVTSYLRRFDEDTDVSHLTGIPFTDPFRYIPDTLVCKAGRMVAEELTQWASAPETSDKRKIERSFAEGKMLGVLIVRAGTETGFLAAFSGTVKGADGLVTASVPGFVPPIIDLTVPGSWFKIKEAEIIRVNERIELLSQSPDKTALTEKLNEALQARDLEISGMKSRMEVSRQHRQVIRKALAGKEGDQAVLQDLIKESQFEKAQLKRAKDRWRTEIESISAELNSYESEITRLKDIRAKMSDSLQKWIFSNATVHNGLGQSSSIWDIFSDSRLVPPGGTGDCAAPKLLEYAYRNGMQPLALGEFWYGQSPDTAVRTHGHFYPSCTSKCGPLLGYMLQGLTLQNSVSELDPNAATHQSSPIIIHQDSEIIVVEKPSGMPSVPGLDKKISLEDWLCRHITHTEVHQIHRLDMDTSGIMIFAKNRNAAADLRLQFENHTIRKTYIARLTPLQAHIPVPHNSGSSPGLKHTGRTDSKPTSGQVSGTGPKSELRTRIELPLAPDYDERPRQKVDMTQGKPAVTDYRIISENPDGTADIIFHPITGRTHQLRVHSAHHLGLGRPIVGDLLYGAHTIDLMPSASGQDDRVIPRLCLHALSITFRHPGTDHEVTFTSDRLSF